MISIGVIVLITLLHAVGVTKGNILNHLLNGVLITTFIILCVKGLATPGKVVSETVRESGPMLDNLSALIPILFTYSGWNAAVYLAEEFKNPQKSIGKAVLFGTSIVIVLYVLINLMYLKFIDPTELNGTIEVGHLLGLALFGENGAIMINIIIMTALLSSISAMVMAGPRIYFAMSRDGLFFKPLSRISTKYQTPALAIIAQSAWCILLVITGSFEQILQYTGFSIILFSALAVLSVFLLRRSMPPISITWQVLYIIFLIVSGMVLISSYTTRTTITLIGTALILIGIPLYFWMQQSNKKHNFEND